MEKYENVLCPICGSKPKIHALYAEGDRRPRRRPDDFNEYKVSCPKHHLDCGDWKDTKLKAYKDWIKRIKDTSQPDFCFNDNHFSIQKMDVDEMAEFLLRFMDGEFQLNTEKAIKEWLKRPVDGLYPKGYPGVPKELQSNNEDVYEYRLRQAACKIGGNK